MADKKEITPPYIILQGGVYSHTMKTRSGKVYGSSKTYKTPKSGIRSLYDAAWKIVTTGAPFAAKHVYETMRPNKPIGIRPPPKAMLLQGRRTRLGPVRGRYVGKFKKPKKVKVNRFTMHMRKGMTSTLEVTGSVADPDCVYLGVTALDGNQAVRITIMALMRKLIRKALNIEISDPDQVIPVTFLVGQANRSRISLFQKSIVTSVETTIVDHILAVGETLNTLTAVFFTTFLNYASLAQQGTAPNNDHISRIIFQQIDNEAVGAVYLEKAMIIFENEVINMDCKVELKIQNRTLSATGGTDAEDVTNGPLVGQVYTFKNIPKLRTGGASFLERSRDVQHGVFGGLASTAGTNLSYREPPNSNIFSNVTKTGKVRLEPGHIKQHNLFMKKDMKFLPFLRYCASNDNVTGYYAYCNGPSVLYALEDVINVNAAQSIAIAYEVNRVFGVHMKTKNKAVALQQFDQVLYNVV